MKRFLDLKIPPIAVMLCMASLMWVVARFLPVDDVQIPGRTSSQPLVPRSASSRAAWG